MRKPPPTAPKLANIVRCSVDTISFIWQFGPWSCKRSLWWCFSFAPSGRTSSWRMARMAPRRDRLRSLFATLWPFGISFSQCQWTSDATTCMPMNQIYQSRPVVFPRFVWILCLSLICPFSSLNTTFCLHQLSRLHRAGQFQFFQWFDRQSFLLFCRHLLKIPAILYRCLLCHLFLYAAMYCSQLYYIYYIYLFIYWFMYLFIYLYLILNTAFHFIPLFERQAVQ